MCTNDAGMKGLTFEDLQIFLIRKHAFSSQRGLFFLRFYKITIVNRQWGPRSQWVQPFQVTVLTGPRKTDGFQLQFSCGGERF